MTYLKTTEKTKIIKKALVAEFGQARVSRDRGTAAHWISSTVYISHVCGESDPCRERSYATNEDCIKAHNEAHTKVQRVASGALAKAGSEFSTFSSDDGYGTELSCHSIKVVLTK